MAELQIEIETSVEAAAEGWQAFYADADGYAYQGRLLPVDAVRPPGARMGAAERNTGPPQAAVRFAPTTATSEQAR